MVKGWEIKLIGDIFDFKNGPNKGKDFFGHGTPIVNYNDVYKNRALKRTDIHGKVDLSTDEIRRFDVRKYDVFFTRTSETPGEVGLTSVLLDDIDNCVFSGFVLRARPKEALLAPLYCQYCFSTPEVRFHIISGCTYTTRALTNGKQLSAIPIPIPPLPEQQRIAEALSDVDGMISSLEKLIAKYKSIKTACLQQMFPQNGETVPRMRLPGFTGVWEQRKLGKLVDVCSGRDYKHLSEGTIPVYGTGGYMLSVNDALSYDRDAIGIGRKGTIDRPYILKAPFWTVDTLFYAIPREKVDLNFAFDIFQNIDWKKKDESTGVPSLSKTAINNIDVLAPKHGEQQTIGQFFAAIDHLITLHQRKLEKVQKIKQGMMQQLLTGKIRLV